MQTTEKSRDGEDVHDDEEARGELSVFRASETAHVEIAIDRSEHADNLGVRVSKRRKSSFMNKVTRADVEVQPYAFTTKSIYVGHTDYKYLRWQVLDTPGILDRPLDERNTIEMQSITALAHLRAVVLYVVDISEQCGFTIKQQSDLFHSIAPLFANKPLVVALNKTDVVKVEELKESDRELLEDMRKFVAGPSTLQLGEDDGDHQQLPTMSTLSEDGVADVKNLCCDRLLAMRVEQKLASRRAGDILNRLHVAQPKARDSKSRLPSIPASLEETKARKARGEKIITEKDLQEQNGGAGVYSADFNKNYLLANDEWKYDVIPEIYNGKNVADFIDPEIEAKLAELEREEEELEKQWEAEAHLREPKEAPLTEEEKQLLGEIKIEKEKVSRGTSTQEISRWKHVEDPSLESRSRRHTYDEKHERIFREHRIRRGQGSRKSAKSIERQKTRTIPVTIPRRRRQRYGRRHGRRGKETNPLLALALQICRQKSRSNAPVRFRSQKYRSEHQSATLGRLGAKGNRARKRDLEKATALSSPKCQSTCFRAKEGTGKPIVVNFLGTLDTHIFLLYDYI